jgi:nitrogen fixation/metabolism regulation signal transduction histidine kinase
MARRADVEEPWREEISLFGESGRKLLTCRGTALQTEDGGKGGMVIVFDDVTALIQAQRDAAWGEVARRLAHEIKNPLTPIQLSAERLRHRYLEKMGADEGDVLDRATSTIVNQVEAMKKMVNAFSEYARVPKLHLEPMDVDRLVREVLELYRGGAGGGVVEGRLDAGGAMIEGDAGRLRQLLHNLVKNALEAVRKVDEGHVVVRTRLADVDGASCVLLSVEDNGAGFDSNVLENVFEPYVSTKPRGSGLGLAIVKKIVEEHGGVVSIESPKQGGARVSVRFRCIGNAAADAGRGEAGL